MLFFFPLLLFVCIGACACIDIQRYRFIKSFTNTANITALFCYYGCRVPMFKSNEVLSANTGQEAME